MTNYDELLSLFKTEIQIALEYLEYSHQKIQALPLDPSDLNMETLETWESYAARFARVTDIFLAKYLRTYVSKSDPAFRGELRDFVNKAEKMQLISSANQWMEIRELRNKISHEYGRSDLKTTFEGIKTQTPFVIKDLKKGLFNET